MLKVARSESAWSRRSCCAERLQENPGRNVFIVSLNCEFIKKQTKRDLRLPKELFSYLNYYQDKNDSIKHHRGSSSTQSLTEPHRALG